MLLDIRGVGADKTFPQNGLQASVCALAKSSNNTTHVFDILSQVLNNLWQVLLKDESKQYLRVVEDIEKCPSPGTWDTHSACPSHGLNQASITRLQYGKFGFKMHLDNRMFFVGRPHKDDLLHIWNIDSKQHPAQVISNLVRGTDWQTCWWWGRGSTPLSWPSKLHHQMRAMKRDSYTTRSRQESEALSPR